MGLRLNRHMKLMDWARRQVLVEQRLLTGSVFLTSSPSHTWGCCAGSGFLDTVLVQHIHISVELGIP